MDDLLLARTPRPQRDALVFQGFEFGKVRGADAWAASITTRADLPGRTRRDLRDTFGSQLVSAGIPLLYVSRQLRHSTTAVTEKHYAKWIPGDSDL